MLALDLSQEVWRLARLVLALAQPLMALLLIVGFLVATAYLLTLIGTHWGDRHANSKSLLFSVALHLFLAVGLVALIPEYRDRISRMLAEEQQPPIRLMQPVDRRNDTNSESPSGRGPLFERFTDAQLSELSRSDSRPEMAAELEPLKKMGDPTSFVPAVAPDRMPSQEQPAPEPEVAAAVSSAPESQDVPAEIQEGSLPTQKREELVAGAADTGRSMLSSSPRQAEIPVNRPEFGNIERPEATPTPESQAPDLMATLEPQASLSRDQNEQIVRRDSPENAEPTSAAAGQMSREEKSPEPAAPLIARTESRVPQTNLPDSGIGRVRPGARSEMAPQDLSPDLQPGRRMALPSLDDVPSLQTPVDAYVARDNQGLGPGGNRADDDIQRGPAPGVPVTEWPPGTVDGTKVRGVTKQYAVEILVRERGRYVVRTPTIDPDGQPFIPLNDQDVYAVRLTNNSQKEVAIDLRIDGVNCFAFSDEKLRFWILPPGQSANILGWHRNGSVMTEFKIVSDSPQTAAARLNLEPSEPYGLITATFHATWPVGGKPPADEPRVPVKENRRGAQGTGFGEDIPVKTAEAQREIGAARDAVSVRYEH